MCFSVADPRLRRIGLANKDNAHLLLNSLAMLPCTRRAHMPIQDFRSLVAGAQADAANPALRAYFRL